MAPPTTPHERAYATTPASAAPPTPAAPPLPAVPEPATPAAPEPPPDEFRCPARGGLMRDPVRTVDGDVFEREFVENFFRKFGVVNPLTGAPLASASLEPLPELAQRIRSL